MDSCLQTKYSQADDRLAIKVGDICRPTEVADKNRREYGQTRDISAGSTSEFKKNRREKEKSEIMRATVDLQPWRATVEF